MSEVIFTEADSVYVDTDEGRFQLHVHTPDGTHFIIDIHADALKFYENVVSEIRPWFLEAEHARQAVAAGVSREDYLGSPQPVTSRPVSVEDAVEAGYALDDPKSPGYHDRMVD